MNQSVTLEQIRRWEGQLRSMGDSACYERLDLQDRVDAGYEALGMPPQDWGAFWPITERRPADWVPVNPLGKADLRAAVWDKTGGKCWYCGIQMNPWRDFCVDHFLARAAGGSDEIENLVPACRSCNMRKGSRSLESLRRRLAGEVIPTFTAAQLEYLHQQGITITPPAVEYTFYFERIGGEGGAA